MFGRKPKAMEVMDEDELRAHLLAILGMTDATRAQQEIVLSSVRSIARKRFTRFSLPTLPKTVAKDVQEMRNAGVSAEIITDFVVQMVPDSTARLQALMQEAAAEIGST